MNFIEKIYIFEAPMYTLQELITKFTVAVAETWIHVAWPPLVAVFAFVAVAISGFPRTGW